VVINGGSTVKNGLVGVATSLANELEVMAEENQALLVTFSPEQASDIAIHRNNGGKSRFRRALSVETTMMEQSFGSATSSNIVLDTMADNNKQSYVPCYSFTQSQTPFTVNNDVKKRRFER